MRKKSQNQYEAFFIVRNLFGKRTHEIDTYLIGPFYSRSEARDKLASLHECTISQFSDSVESSYIDGFREFSRVDTDLVIFSYEIFHKILFL